MPLLRVSDFCRRRTPQHIPIRLAPTITTTTTTATTTTQNQQDYDSSIGYTSANVFRSLSIQEDSFVFLCCSSGRVVLRLKLLDPNNGENEDLDDETGSSVLRVAPVVGANLELELWDDGSERLDCLRLEADCWVETTMERPLLAASVVLRPLGNNARSWPRFFEEKPQEGDTSSWVFPQAKSLVQVTNLISVYNSKHQEVLYYEVLEVAPREDSQTVAVSSFFQILSSTEFVLDRSPLGAVVRRLPPLFDQFHICSNGNTSNNPQQQHVVNPPPHPNIPELIHAFRHFPSSANETILHVIGNDRDHHVRVAVKTAANRAGMRCLSIRGLAAFAHHHGHDIRTGSLVDQLTGLQAAVSYIRRERMEPCVLHVYDFETELSSIDQLMRHEQEERFWSKWMGMRTTSTTTTAKMTTSRREAEAKQHANNKTSNAAGDPRERSKKSLAPNMLLVLSTSSPLKPGPLMENMVFASIPLELPNLAYTKYLWTGAQWDDELIDVLPGRPAREILELRQKVLADAAAAKDAANEFIHKIRDYCSTLDEERRKQSSNLAQISNVHWEDVGGLAHVRTEIMDAIELPLKHPHLFPKSGGRSGILLYGPPGTGKTLVAKAVATECGLPFVSVKGPELLGSYVGESEANIRDVFRSARQAALKNAPNCACILFFDELDSLAPRRGGVGDGGGVMERVVATLFAELDGSGDVNAGRVFVMGATNRPDLLDPSLLRSGRFDRLVYLGIPTDSAERARVLAAQIRKLRLDGDADEMAKAVVSELPAGLTGADMSTIASGAILNAVHRLCRSADQEQRSAEKRDGTKVSIEQIIELWDEDRKTPVVCLADLQLSAKDVSPSVSTTEMLRYEHLRQEFSSTAVGCAVEHDGEMFYD